MKFKTKKNRLKKVTQTFSNEETPEIRRPPQPSTSKITKRARKAKEIYVPTAALVYTLVWFKMDLLPQLLSQIGVWFMQ